MLSDNACKRLWWKKSVRDSRGLGLEEWKVGKKEFRILEMVFTEVGEAELPLLGIWKNYKGE